MLRMLRILFSAIFMLTVIAGIIPVSAEIKGLELHVSVSGSNSNPGTEDKPLATLDGARAAVKSLKEKYGKDTPVTVWFHGGTYNINKTVIFDESDSGTEQGPITYAGYNNEKVNFSGSYQLNPNSFKPVTDENILARLPAEGREKVGVLDLKSHGISSIPAYIIPSGYMDTPPSYSWLFLNGMEQPISRWPNTGYARIEKVVDQGAIRRNGDTSNRPAVFKYKGTRPNNWVTAKDALLEGFFLVDYAQERLPLGKVDVKNSTITTGQSTTYGVAEGKRWAVFNLLEELDSPGEWYIDRENLLLYYYPPYTLNGVKLELSMFKDAMIKANKTSNIIFRGLTFENTCGNVMELTGCTNITVGGCTLRNIGRQGIVIKQGKNNSVIGCDIMYMGGIAVYLDGGDRQTLTPGNNRAVNNHFYQLGRQTKTYAGALEVMGVGNIVEHNLIHEAPHQAMRIHGNDHKIRFNEIYNVVKESLDAGAIYMGRDYTARGNEISYNYIHDIATSVAGQGGLHASEIYLDDQWCGTYVHHNILTNASLALLLGGGQYNRFENNIVVGTQIPIAADNRGENWAKAGSMPGGENYNTLLKVPYNQPPYSEKYPELAHILDIGPGLPMGNVIKDNLIVKSGKANINDSVTKRGEIENNIYVDEDPGFVNMDKQDYQIKSDAKILTQLRGLSDISMDKIGLVTDEYRKNIERPNFEFKLISPKNGQVDINGLSSIFRWDAAQFADKYHVTIAEDPEMKNIVYQADTVYNYLEVKSLKSGQKNYYWKVEAINYSYQTASRGSSKGAPYLFTTTLNDVLFKDNLNALIESSEKTLNTIVEGDMPGQYKQGAKAWFEKAIVSAKQAASLRIGTQEQIDQAEKALSDAVIKLGSMINKGYVGVENMLKDPADWISSKGSIKIADNVLTFSEKDPGVTTAGFIKEPMRGYEVYCFKMKTDLNNKWIGIGLKQNKPEGQVWRVGGTGYLIVVKPDQIELQRFLLGVSEFLNIMPNTFITNNEWHDIQVGAVNSGGGVLLIFKVDGKTVFNQIDTARPITDSGIFTLYDITGGKYISIAPADKLPSGDVENQQTAENFAEPAELNLADLLKDQGSWKAPSGKVSFNQDNVLNYVDDLKSSILAYNKIMPNNTVYNFRVKFNLGTKWQALGIRAKSNASKPWLEDGGGYLIAIKPDSVELQRFNKGTNEFLSIVDNNFIKSGEWCDVKLAAYDAPGGVRLLFTVNGQTVFDYLDPMPVTEPGYFALYDFSGLGIEVSPTK